MSMQFEAEIRAEYIFLSCTGVLTVDALLQVFDQGFSIAEEKEVRGVLIDIREVEGATPSTTDRFSAGVALAKMQRKQSERICVAVVGNKPLVDRFGETVAFNRGATGKAFTVIDDAVTWLEEWIE